MVDKRYYFVAVLFSVALLFIAVGVAWMLSADYGICSPHFLISLGFVLIGICFVSLLIVKSNEL